MVSKNILGGRIKALRLKNAISQEEMGSSLDLSRSAVSQIEAGQIYPSLETLAKIVKCYSIHWDDLVGGGPVNGDYVASPQLRTLVATVDSSGKDNIVLVPVKAQAGYLLGTQQPDYFERLPTFHLPGLNNGTFRAFEVNGYSMLSDRIGFFPGDIVIAEYVERVEEIRDGLIYILVNNAQEVDDIVLKRCINYINKGGVIICKSDNKDGRYPTFSLHAQDIKEVWKFKMKITRHAPEPTELFERIGALEGEIQIIKDQLKNRNTIHSKS